MLKVRIAFWKLLESFKASGCNMPFKIRFLEPIFFKKSGGQWPSQGKAVHHGISDMKKYFKGALNSY
jgi:hypothetical protein